MLNPRNAVALLTGILACLWLPFPSPRLLIVDIFALAILFACGSGWRRTLAVACFGFALAGTHLQLGLSRQLPVAMEHRTVEVQGTVRELPVHEPRRTRFVLEVDDAASQSQALRGKRLRLAWYDDFDNIAHRDPSHNGAPSLKNAPRHRLAAGSRWRLMVKLRAPRGLRNPGGVDGEKHALMERIAATGFVRDPASARRIAPAGGIDAWRETMSARIAATVPRASSRFLRALALGDTRSLEDADWEILRANGLTHLIAISGFHVGLVAGASAWIAYALWWCLPGLARRVPRPQAVALAALCGAAGYAALAGFALPTLRTVLMIAVVAAARCARRGWRPVDALSAALIVLSLCDPLSILGAGYWLSFAGVAWLLWCLPQSSGHWLRDFASAQWVATVGLLPLSAALFGQASLAGPLANLLAIPWWSLLVVPLALIGTALDAMHTGWGEGAWRWAAWAFEPSWSLFSRLSESPLALWWLPEPAWFALPLASLAAFWCLLPRGVPGKPLALLLWLPLLWPNRELPARGDAEVVVLDVGQGLSVLVRTAGHSVLYDMGAAVPEGFDAGERAVVPALHALGVRRLDAAVVSHGDNDHAGGYEAVAETFAIPRSYMPEDSGLERRIRKPAVCRAGLRWRWDEVEFRFLHPPPHFPYLRNESSCVLRVRTRHGAVLLTGDIGEVIERDLVRRDRASVRADVVLVAHHGSGGSSDPAFVTATGARIAPVSAGYGNRFRHPKSEVVALWRRRGAEVPSTADGGALRIRLEAGGPHLLAERYRRPKPWDAVRRQAGAGQLSYRSK